VSFLSRFSKKPAALKFSWILPNQLAIGPAPLTTNDWRTLQQAGFQSRFSCCYLQEEEAIPHFNLPHAKGRVALPDHRLQEPLLPSTLLEAIMISRELMDQAPPLYVHCWAGRERSVLLAIAHMSIIKQISVYAAMLRVREAHPPANPLYDHLELLEEVLNEHKPTSLLSSEPALHTVEASANS
jgi:hypothetical protein